MLVAPAVTADTITKIGMVDIERIATAYFRESQAHRNYEEQRAQVGREAEQILEEIRELENQRLSAERDGNRPQALALSDEVFNLREYYGEFVRIRNEQLRRDLALLSSSDIFLGALADAIQFVAEQQGYSLVLRKNDQFLFFLPEIDLTDAVITRLAQVAGR